MTAPCPSPLTAERARKLLSYDLATGVFHWLIHANSRAPRGSVAGRIADSGYRMIRIEGRSYRASRLAWLIVTGEWPENYIDHRNRDRADNRWANLRHATKQENQRNQPPRSHYKGKARHSPFKGVMRQGQRWAARIMVDGKVLQLGVSETSEAAARAYDDAARKHFGEFAYLNFPDEVAA